MDLLASLALSLEEWEGRDGEEKPRQELLDTNSTLDVSEEEGALVISSDTMMPLGGSKTESLLKLG